MDHYLNEAEVLSAMDNLAAAYPSLCEILTLPHQTFEHRTVRALHIGNRGAAAHPLLGYKVGVLFTGCAHAREWGGADVLIYLASDLLSAYAAGLGLSYAVPGKGAGVTFSAAQLALMRDRVDLFLVPMVNPDGRAYSQTIDPVWRKNRNPASSGGVDSRIGVDVNRNFDFLWDYKKAFSASIWSNTGMASDDPGSDNFHGTAPNSEPETKNIIHLFTSQPNIQYFVDVHSYTGDVLYKWGDSPDQTTKPIQNFLNPNFDALRGVDNPSIYGEYIDETDKADTISLANRMTDTINAVSGAGYQTTQGFYLAPGAAGGSTGKTYPSGGCADDYASSRSRAIPGATHVMGYTLEFHKFTPGNAAYAYHPDFPKMAEIVAEVDAGLIAFCLAAEERSRRPIPVPERSGRVSFSVTVDGGGLVWINGVPHPEPPWGPLVLSVMSAVQVYVSAAMLPAGRAKEAQRVALDAVQDAIDQARGPG